LLASGPKAPEERRLTSVPHLTPAIHAPPGADELSGTAPGEAQRPIEIMSSAG